MPVSPVPAPDSSRPRAARWLTGAAVLALTVQAIFVLMPEPKSAGAPDPAAPETAAALDSTAFTLEDSPTVLPGAPAPDSAAPPTADSVRLLPAPPTEPEPLPPASGAGDGAPVNADTTLRRPLLGPDSTDGAQGR